MKSLRRSNFYNFCFRSTRRYLPPCLASVVQRTRTYSIFKWGLCSARRRKCKQLPRYTFQRFLRLAFRYRPRFPDLLTKPILLGEVHYLPDITNRETKAHKSVTLAVQACFMTSCLRAGSERTCSAWEANLAPSDLAKFGKQHVRRTGLRSGVLCCPLDVLRSDFKCLPEECAVRCIAGTLLPMVFVVATERQ